MLILLAALPAQAAQPKPLTVFAAASLTDAFQEIGTAFTAQTGIAVEFNFSSASALVAQLEQGAPADIFASADTRQMANAQKAGRIGTEPVIFTTNVLTVVFPADNPAKIATLADLARPGVRLILVAVGTPIRVYAEEVLQKLADSPDYPDDFKAQALKNLVSEEPTVRQVVAKIALGEADAALLYRSDATPKAARAVATLPIPNEYNVIATYPIALTSESAQPERAQQFIAFVLSEAGQAILIKWGFSPLSILEPAATAEPTSHPTTEATLEATPRR